MIEPAWIVDVAELDFAFEPTRWTFAETRSADIAAHWTRLTLTNPALYNGRVLLLRHTALTSGPNGERRLSGAFFETSYADFIAWRDFGHPGEAVDNCFSMAALRGADGAFLLGEMAPHTHHAGQIYFPAGTPDPSDVFEGKVDLGASAERELLEETGVRSDEAAIAREWTVLFAGRRIACMKQMTLPVAGDEAKARIDAFLALDRQAELSCMHIVRSPRDIDEERTPAFVAAYLRSQLG